MSRTRLVVDGTSVVARVRLFRDDLEVALRAHTGDAALAIARGTTHDSLVGAYWARRVTLEADGRPVRFAVVAAGLETDEQQEPVVWYVLEGRAAAPPRRLRVHVGVLCEAFRDQQNLVQILHAATDRRQTLYFTSGDDREQEVRW